METEVKKKNETKCEPSVVDRHSCLIKGTKTIFFLFRRVVAFANY